MKKMIHLMTCAVVAAMSMEAARATLNVPSNGSDGHLVVTNNLVIDLSRAITAPWDSINTGANIGIGRYDSNKWAVVYHYQSVTIQAGATVTFKNHASRAPVVWLVSGDVTINGTVSLDGQSPLFPPWLAEPGPGGFRGGSGNYGTGAGAAPGFGPGGGAYIASGWGGGGSYGSLGYNAQPTYGNPSLIPLVGGSGGGGHADASTGRCGGAGAGAILIASAGSVFVSGVIRANGGGTTANNASGGSGGAVRLVAETLAGSGVVQALAGPAIYNLAVGGVGRIRIERGTNTSNLQITPDPSVVTLPSGATPQIWVPTTGPAVRIVSIGGNTLTTDPRAEFGAVGADTVLPRVTNTTVVVETTNVEQASVVTVRATPRSDGNFTQATAIPSLPPVSEDPLVIRWMANVPVKDGYAAIQVKVVRP